MAAGLNKIFLIGNLTRDPELRYTANGMAVASFTLALNRNYSTPSGEKKSETTFIRMVAWGKRGEICAEYLRKGSLVFAEGRIQSRSWQGQDGAKRTTVEVVVNNVQFLGVPKSQAQAAGRRPPAESQEPLSDMPDLDIPPDVERSENNAENEVPF